MDRHTRIILAGILLLGLLLRLAGGMVVARQVEAHGIASEPAFLFPDSDNFWAYAGNLSTRGEYVDEQNRHAWRTPAYSIFLAGLHAAGVRDAAHLRLLNNGIGLLNILLAYSLGAILFNKRVGLVAAAFTAMYPFFVYFDNLVLADTLGVTSVLLVTLAFVRAVQWIDSTDATYGPAPQPPPGGRGSNGIVERDGRGDAATAAHEDSHPRGGKGGVGKETGCPAIARSAHAFAAGLVLAFAIMVKAAFAFLGLFFFAFFVARLWRRKRDRGNSCCPIQRTLLAMLFVLVALGIGMTPWWLRNYRVFGSVVPFSTMGGYTLYESNNPNSDGGPNNGKVVFPVEWRLMQTVLNHGSDRFATQVLIEGAPTTFYLVPYAFYEDCRTQPLRDKFVWVFDVGKKQGRGELPGPSHIYFSFHDPNDTLEVCEMLALTELWSDRYLKRSAFTWIRRFPFRFLSLMPVKIGRTWNVWPNWDGASAWKYKAVSLLSYVPVMLLAMVALWVYRREWRTVYLLIIPALYITALHSIFMGSIRYRLPAMGPLLVLAAAGFVMILDALKRRRQGPQKSA